MLPYISAVSPDGGLQLPALQPAALPQAIHEAALAHAEANDGQRPQAQQTDAMPGQPNAQQVNGLNLCGITDKVLLFCNGPNLQAAPDTALLAFAPGLVCKQVSCISLRGQVCAALSDSRFCVGHCVLCHSFCAVSMYHILGNNGSPIDRIYIHIPMV